MTSKPTIAVLGGSGGCAGTALAKALINGHSCRALARNPDKLRQSLLGRQIPADVLDKHLVVVPGNAKNVADLKTLLLDAHGNLPDKILFGVGAAPKLKLAINFVDLDDPHVCETAAAALTSALSDIATTKKSSPQTWPCVSVVSTTGIAAGPRDVPLLFLPLYHWLLHVPHQDKVKMERILRQAGQGPSASTGVESTTVVRASLLTDGNELGLEHVRSGIESKPAVGYTISRKDVGNFLYEKLLKSTKTSNGSEPLTVTY